MPFTDATLRVGYALLDKVSLIPDFVIRAVIRALCRQRLREIDHGSFEANHAAKMEWIERVRARDSIADHTKKANEQHYEISTNFMLSCLGPYAKYSCCLFPTGRETLEEAEVLMLDSYCRKAQVRDGMDILDLGCGWGSLTLYLAEKYPKSRITALSNSATQKLHIEAEKVRRGITNIEVITADVNDFDFENGKPFDRILSIEMFEHMKNYKMLMAKVASWLRPNSDSLFFVHIFCHRTTPYHFEENDGWMAQNFFSGGTMPSHDLLLYFQEDLALVRSWYLSGEHYARTCRDWLKRQDLHTAEGIEELRKNAFLQGLEAEEGKKTFYRFRVFYMACEELFGLNGGQEWGIGHYLFKRNQSAKRP
ncbi:S-adenosyl-L-methionine-dependent methyltransferase [Laetiporus sulphureus 93-53]|uniref:S-adenosyl-L-methionine-dependent methyltransferase n=1 Tax=Laetiporus sulphureus 93-53 TaxID=1314785 RepID=A0A165GSS3_9APHY|nr:S-adenosyl-L-methionine-dependent methyltransferase [Laetiporus sulphureus 93-53]KZT10760.1 S-adenosyl-L-methionine-dependent methyltransferase [Laetiporus sulphureus 93-53]